MNSTLKAVASFTDSAWCPVGSDWMSREVIEQWANDVGDVGLGFEDVTTDVEWQAIDADTMAFRISGKVLLVIEWDYDVDQCGEDYHPTLTIHSWQMGTEAQDA